MDINNTIKSAFENYQAGNLQEAVSLCKEIVKIHPNNVSAINLLGIISYQLKDYDSAIQYMKAMINLCTDNAQVYYILGHSLQGKGNLDEAIAYYKKSLQLNPNFVDTYYNLGTIFQDKKQYVEAISCYKEVLQINPNDVDAYYNLGLVLQEGKRHDEAVFCFSKALQFNPNLDEVYGRIGLSLHEKGQSDEAIRYFRRAFELNPHNGETYFNLGVVFQGRGQLDEAISCYKKALGLNFNIADIHNNLGVISQEKGRINEAIMLYKKALELDPLFAKAQHNLDGALVLKGACKEILVLGDSHALVFCNKKFETIFPDYFFNIVVVGGATVSGLENPNSKTQALPIFMANLERSEAKTVIVLLGEVDVGFVICYRAQKYNTSVEAMLDKAVRNYQRLLSKIAERSHVICISTPLPTIKDGNVANARRDVKTTQLQRTKLTLEFNKRMKYFCEMSGISYLSLDQESLGEDGLVKCDLATSDPKDVHYDNEKHSDLIVEKLVNIIT